MLSLLLNVSSLSIIQESLLSFLAESKPYYLIFLHVLAASKQETLTEVRKISPAVDLLTLPMLTLFIPVNPCLLT